MRPRGRSVVRHAALSLPRRRRLTHEVTGQYRLEREGRTLDSGELIDLWERWIAKYPIILLEDGLAEDDWAGWKELTRRLGSKVQLVGADIVVTNPLLIARAIDEQAMNSILIKLKSDRHPDRDDLGRRHGSACRLVGLREPSVR